MRQVPQRRPRVRALLDGFEIGNRTQQFAAIAERRNTDLFEVLIGQVTQDREIDIVVGKALGVSDKPSFSSQSAICCIATPLRGFTAA